MKVEITVKTSELFCEIYEFEATYDYIEYTGYSYSRRNSPNDPWGHEWTEFYAKERALIDEKFDRLMEEVDNECDADMVRLDWNKELEAFNPVCNKTIEGEPFYGGQFGPSKWLPKLPWTPKKVEKLVIEEMTKKLKKTKKSVRIE